MFLEFLTDVTTLIDWLSNHIHNPTQCCPAYRDLSQDCSIGINSVVELNIQVYFHRYISSKHFIELKSHVFWFDWISLLIYQTEYTHTNSNIILMFTGMIKGALHKNADSNCSIIWPRQKTNISMGTKLFWNV